MNKAIQSRELAITLAPLTVNIGAEVHGIDLSKPLTNEQFEAIRQAMIDWKVIFFRDQDITTEQHLAFARRFGELEVHPFAYDKEGYPEVMALTHNRENRARENLWHSDVTWRAEPSLGSVLRGVEMPPVGGDTLFSDMYAAYDGLTDEIKEKLDGKFAMHDASNFIQMMREHGAPEEKIAELERRFPPQEHPVFRTHPETGRKTIYVNVAFTRHIVGMDRDESDAMLKHLFAQAAIPEYQCRFRWRNNSIAFWDNRACQHYAVADYWPATRRVERVTIIGDRPY
jgi:taurine dioxygenase